MVLIKHTSSLGRIADETRASLSDSKPPEFYPALAMTNSVSLTNSILLLHLFAMVEHGSQNSTVKNELHALPIYVKIIADKIQESARLHLTLLMMCTSDLYQCTRKGTRFDSPR